MLPFEEHLIKHGKSHVFEVSHDFKIDDPTKVWYLQAGHLDFFYRDLADINQKGRLHPLFRVESGALIFGIDTSDQPFEIAAIGGIQPKVIELDFEFFSQMIAEGAYLDIISDRLDNWIEQVYKGIPLIRPHRHRVIRHGEDLELKAGQVVVSRNEVFWVALREGAVKLMGESLFSPAMIGTHWIPVSSQGWMEVTEETVLTTKTTEELLKEKEGFASVSQFHAWAVEQLPQTIEKKIHRELALLRQNSQIDERELDQTIQDLSDILQPQPQEAKLMQAAEDPLEAAALLVAEKAGIALNLAAKKGPDYNKDPLGNLARNSRIRFRTVLLSGDWWQHDNGPLLGWLESGQQPVALIPSGKTSYLLCDPVSKTTTPINADVANTLDGQAKMFYRPLPDKALTIRDLIQYAKKPIMGDLWVVFLTGLAGGLMGLITPFATGLVFDSAIPKSDRTELAYIGMALLICAISTALFNLTRSIAMLRFEGKIDASLQAAIWDRLLSLPVPFFREFTAGDLADRAMGINQIRNQISGTVIVTMVGSIFSIFYFFQLYYYSWELALVGMALTVIALLPASLSIIKIRYERQSTEIEGKLTGLVFQFILGVSKIRTSGAEKRAFTNWAGLFGNKQRLNIKTGTIQNILISWNDIFPLLASMTIFAYIVYYIEDPNALTTGDFLAFNSAFALFLAGVLAMSDAAVSVLKVIPLYERSKPILESVPEHDLTLGDPGILTGNIEVSNVSFRYEEDGPLILNQVSCKVEPGKFVALVGPSGSGKSTLFRLLLGFEHPESGEIFYDGQQLSGLDIRSVRRQIGVVLQNGQLMSGDIFSNILGSLPLTLDDAWEAAEMAGLDTDIKEMPMGMHTVVSEGAGTLSGGQVQRLLIARALVSKPRILFFDEATSALDNQTQAIVSSSIDQLDVTRIVIAHRLSTIKNADLILVMEKGNLVQSGTYDELLNQPGVFADLAKRQIA